MLDTAWKKHKELVPEIPTMITTLAKETSKRLDLLRVQLTAAEKELAGKEIAFSIFGHHILTFIFF